MTELIAEPGKMPIASPEPGYPHLAKPVLWIFISAYQSCPASMARNRQKLTERTAQTTSSANRACSMDSTRRSTAISSRPMPSASRLIHGACSFIAAL